MEKHKSRAIGIELEMQNVVKSVITRRIRPVFCQLFKRDDEFRFSCVHIHPPNPRIVRLRMKFLTGWLRDISITRTRKMDTIKIQAQRLCSIFAQRIDWARQRPPQISFLIDDFAHVIAILVVVVDKLTGAPQPLQHGTLLPAPSPSLSENSVLAGVFEVYPTDACDIVRFRHPIVKIAAEMQEISSRVIPRAFVIVTEEATHLTG
ncbi:MAG: hypothetical protein ACYC6Y_11025 [Thermoguttaceae bacterium]